MSRTFRRNKKPLILMACGTLSEAIEDSSWIMHRHPMPTIEQAYQKKVALYTGDNHSGKFRPARWWVRQYYTRPNRRLAGETMRHSLLNDGGESYLEPINKGALWFYFWQM